MNGSQPIDDDVLARAVNSANTFAAKMEEYLSARSTIDAINQAKEMLENLRSIELSPKSYYQLYLIVTDKLRILEAYLIKEHNTKERIPDLYMRVQFIADILPRLYLMITVGVYLIKCGGFSRCEMMRDLVEMCRGVQNPLRGLFLRNFLLQAMHADLLPGVEPQVSTLNASSSDLAVTPNGRQPEKVSMSTDGTLMDAIEFLIHNFTEMVKLWVRMQYQGHSRDRERREQDRQDLRLLVGTNLTRLSQLEAIDAPLYRKHVLQPICAQLIQCDDLIAQQYLMDVIVQVFSNEFHLSTLDILLHVCGRLHHGVKIREIICDLIDRLSVYVANEQAYGRSVSFPPNLNTPTSSATSMDADAFETPDTIPPDSTSEFSSNLKLFNIFFAEICKLLTRYVKANNNNNNNNSKKAASEESVLQATASRHRNGLPAEDVPPIFASLARMALLFCQDRSVEHVDKCLVTTAEHLEALGVVRADPKSRLSVELSRLLCLPLERPVNSSSAAVDRNPKTSDAMLLGLRTVIGMSGFHQLANLLDVATERYTLACSVLNLVLEQLCRRASSTSSRQLSARCRLLDENDLENFFKLISGMLQPVSGPGESPADWELCAESQSLITVMIHLLGPEERSADPDLCCRLLQKTYMRLARAGSPYIRSHFPAIVFEGLHLLKSVQPGQMSDCDRDAERHPIIEIIQRCIDSLVAAESSELALRLYLNAAVIIDGLPSIKHHGDIVYDFISKALTLHEEGVERSRSQVHTLSLVINCLYRLVNLDRDSRMGLCSQCLRAAMQLLQKHDQSRSVAMVAHVYWPLPPLARRHVSNRLTSSSTSAGVAAGATPSVNAEAVASSSLTQLQDGEAVMKCLKKAVNLANHCIDVVARIQLLLDLLNEAVGLRLNGCTQVTEGFINDLVTPIRELFAKLDQSYPRNVIAAYMNSTLNFIKFSRSPKVNADGVEGEDEIDQVSDLFATINITPIPVMPQPGP